MRARNMLARTHPRTWWAWLAAGGFGLLAVWVRRTGLLPGDVRGLEFIQAHPLPGLRLFALVGSVAGIIALTVFLGWTCRQWLRPVVLVAAMALVPVIEETLKLLVHRSRPTGRDLGFPSGHAIASLTLTLLICASLWRVLSGWGKLVAVVAGAIFVVGVTGSRLAMGLHWPSDVVGGWLVALAYGLWTIPLVRRQDGG